MLKQNLDGFHDAAQNGYTEIVKILFPLTKNPNIPTKDGENPIFTAALFGNKEIIQILAPLTDYPNAPKENGRTPIEIARNS